MTIIQLKWRKKRRMLKQKARREELCKANLLLALLVI